MLTLLYEQYILILMMKKINDRFIRIADAVSFGMGSPTNIFFWLLAVAIWFVLGATQPARFTGASFLPEWFTSTAWNFPLNTVTTLAELYIGFLVAAATNRAERELRKIIEGMRTNLDQIKKINENQDKILELLVNYQERELAEEKKVLKEVQSLKQ